MNDSDFIEEIARKWVELGGDSDGVVFSWKRLQEAVINIEYAQQSRAVDLPTESRQPSWAADGLDDAVIGSLP